MIRVLAMIYQYSVESTDLVATHELHTKACRAIEFSQSGDLLFTTSADKSIMVTDSATGKLRQFYDDAHEDPVYTLAVIDEHLIATGDENGVVRMWDLREKSHVFSSKKMEDYVSKILTNEEARYLVCCSGEGTITSFDIAGKCVHIQVGFEPRGLYYIDKLQVQQNEELESHGPLDHLRTLRASMLRSPQRSARKHASVLGLSNRSVRKILHEDLHFHPYKMAIVQELSECDYNNRRNRFFWVLFLGTLLCFLVTKPIFICVGP
ncbi:WD domain repeat-containing protein 55 [Homalodisca vitripennis]|nr:WD domain repeat-containing protein 55 [Homalodisca vitripennis]